MEPESAFTQTTNAVSVSVMPVYLENHSNPDDNIFVWAYHICIENQGSQTFQLLSRYWKITDCLGRVQEVKGGGVIGEQPVIPPGTNFEYTSSVTLSLPSGIMTGYYEMQSTEGENFEVTIPLFSLDSPHVAKTVH